MPSQERKEPDLQLADPGAAALARGEIRLRGALRWASNHVFFVECSDGAESVAAVYKPASGERPLWDFPSATLCRRENAAYLVSRALGWDLVPATVLRDGPRGIGSVQRFIEHDPDEHFFTLREAREAIFMRIAVFDMLCNNADRKSGHCLIDGEGRIWAIDNSLTFHVDAKLRTVIWDYAGRRIPAGLRTDIRRLCGELGRADSAIVARLRELLSPGEINALEIRAAALSEPGRFPRPSSEWSFPWPLV